MREFVASELTAPIAYVECAIAALKLARNEADLIEWWKSEQPNRAKWRLSPTQDPGLKLKEAFELKRTQLIGTQNEVLRSIPEQVSQRR